MKRRDLLRGAVAAMTAAALPATAVAAAVETERLSCGGRVEREHNQMRFYNAEGRLVARLGVW